MKRKVFKTNKSVDFPAFSQAIIAGDFIFLSGQCAIGKEATIKDISDHKLKNIPVKSMSFREQMGMTLNNVKTILEEAGTSMENVVRTRVYLANMDDYDEMCEIYSKFFPKDPPARCTIEVSRLVLNLLVEVEVTAILPDKKTGAQRKRR